MTMFVERGIIACLACHRAQQVRALASGSSI
jgi:hypothetical protein